MPLTHRHFWRIATSVLLIALIVLCVVWEGFFAPLRPGGSWLTLKAVPLLMPLFGILNARPYHYRALALLLQFYLLEGLVRISDPFPIALCAALEIVISLALFVALVAFLRCNKNPHCLGECKTANEKKSG